MVAQFVVKFIDFVKVRFSETKPQLPSKTPFPGQTPVSTFQTGSNIRLDKTTISLLQPPSSAATTTAPFIISTVTPSSSSFSPPPHFQLYHPLTSKPTLFNLPLNFDPSKLHPTALSVSFLCFSSPSFHKIIAFPPPIDFQPHVVNSRKSNLLVLYNGGDLQGRAPCQSPSWVKLSDGENFDDVVVFKGKIYSLSREGRLNFVNCGCKKNKAISIGSTVVSTLSSATSGRFGWRKRLVVDGSELYLVVRTEERFFEVYKFVRRKNVGGWEKVGGFDGGRVLFMARDYWFFMKAGTGFPGREYRNCIVFSEAAFPVYGKDCWEFTQSESVGRGVVVRRSEDDIAVFRLDDGVFAREGESREFPKINWSPPAWIFQDFSDDVDFEPRSSSQSESDPMEDETLDSDNQVEKGGEVNSDLKDSNSKDEKDGEIQSDLDSQDEADGKMQCDSNSREKEDEEMLSNPNVEGVESLQEDVSPSLVGPESETTDTVTTSLSATEKEVTRTLLSMNGRNDATEQGTPRKTTTQPVPRACTSSATMSHGSDSTITKFEGFDIKPDLVPTLQKIWQKHGNIVESSTIRNCDIIAKALESLATMVNILEDNSAQSLTDSQADYLSSTLSDLKCICFKVCWLVPFVEKAVKLHKGKHLPDALKNLNQLHSQVKERRAILFGEFAKLGVEENKLKEEMVKVSKRIALYRKDNFDEPLGLGLT